MEPMTKAAHMFSFQEDLVEHYSYGNEYLFVLPPFDTLQMCYNYNSKNDQKKKILGFAVLAGEG